MMKTPQVFRNGLLAIGVLTLAAGCGDLDDADAPEPVEAVERGGTVVIAEVADINVPAAAFAATVLEGNLSADVLSMEVLRGSWEDGRIVYQVAGEHPLAIARRYQYLGPDSAALRVHLRSDVRWSDGQPLTARDVEYTYRVIGSPEAASPLIESTQRLDSVVVENDSTLTYYFDRRHPQMLRDVAVAPLPAHVFGDTPPDQIRTHPALREPAGGRLPVSGPFMIGQWVRGQQIVLVPNPHFQPRANLDRIVVRIIPDATTRVVELRTGGVDFMQNVGFDQIPSLMAQAPHIRFEREEKRFYDYIAYNPEAHPAFADPEIRRALGLAIDMQSILRALGMTEYAVPAGGPYSPIFADLYDPELTPPLQHDPERARQILEAKGWRDTDGDGIREKGGRELSFALVTNVGNQRRADAAQIIQQQWRNIGVDARLEQRETNTLFGALVERDYEAALMGWQVQLSPDLTGLWAEDAPFNFTGYRNPEVTALFERARSQPTPEAAAPYWRQAAARIAQDQPYTFLYYMDAVDGVNERVRDIKVNSYGYWQNAWEWWVPRAQRRNAPATTAASPS